MVIWKKIRNSSRIFLYIYTMSINVKCLLVVGEFKQSSSYSQVESDVVKLGKQMRTIYNELVFHHIPHPVVCGIICQGDGIFVMIQITYVSIMQIEAFIFLYTVYTTLLWQVLNSSVNIYYYTSHTF